MKANYHTHTVRCKHARGEDEAYVEAALRAGFDLLGFSDHAPWPFARDYVSGIRMDLQQLGGYVQSIRRLRDQYAGQINILLGLECEYFPRYHDHVRWLRDRGLDYLILGQHSADSEEDTPYTNQVSRTSEGVLHYAETTVKGIQTGLYDCLAHPDMMMSRRNPDEFDAACMEAADMICQAAKEMRLPIEYNLLGLDCQLRGQDRGYPCAPFWQYIRKWDNEVILGLDAHQPSMLTDLPLWKQGGANVESMGYRLLDHLPLCI